MSNQLLDFIFETRNKKSEIIKGIRESSTKEEL